MNIERICYCRLALYTCFRDISRILLGKKQQHSQISTFVMTKIKYEILKLILYQFQLVNWF